MRATNSGSLFSGLLMLVGACGLLVAGLGRADAFGPKPGTAQHYFKLRGSTNQADEQSLCRVKKNAPGGLVNVRDAPNLSGRVVGTLKAGTLVYPGDSVTDQRGVVWVHVRKSPRGKLLGWVSFVNLDCAG